jgi:hypothetical protein
VLVHDDRIKAALERMDPDATTDALTGCPTGTVTTQIDNGVKLIGARV